MTGDLGFGDNDKAIFGAGSDLQIYHDGSNSYITDTTGGNFFINDDGAGYLMMKGSDLYFRNTNNEDMIHAQSDGFVKLYHNGSTKLATTSTGVDITGTLTSDGLNINAGASGNFGAVISSATSFSIDALRLQRNGSPAQGMNISAGGESVIFDSQNTGSGGLHSIFDFKSTDETTTKSVVKFNGKTNDISFYEDTGTTPKFFWDASAESLGIGTSSPAYKLQVVDTADVDVNLIAGKNSGDFASITFGDTDYPAEGRITYQNSDNAMRFWANRIHAMTIDSSGNVGIGTDSPAYPLEVMVGASRVLRAGTSFVSIDATGSASAPSLIIDGDDNTGFWHPASDTLAVSTAATERMRIDSSGNLLVGTTDINPFDNTSGSGIALRSSGAIYNAIAGGTPLVLNRMTSDGTIAQFRKDGSTVGSIGVEGGDLYIDGATDHLRFHINGSEALNMNNTADFYPASGFTTATLGLSSRPFSDLYLSGGVYLGGTGSANKLDDYETGTFTPTLTGSAAGGTATYVGQDGKYTKVGNQVTAYVSVNVSALSGATGDLRIESLPFTSASGSFSTGSIMINNLNWDTGTYAVAYIGSSQSYCRIFLMADNAAWASQAPTNESQQYYLTLTYQVPS
jgi:hypothetical protein